MSCLAGASIGACCALRVAGGCRAGAGAAAQRPTATAADGNERPQGAKAGRQVPRAEVATAEGDVMLATGRSSSPWSARRLGASKHGRGHPTVDKVQALPPIALASVGTGSDSGAASANRFQRPAKQRTPQGRVAGGRKHPAPPHARAPPRRRLAQPVAASSAAAQDFITGAVLPTPSPPKRNASTITRQSPRQRRGQGLPQSGHSVSKQQATPRRHRRLHRETTRRRQPSADAQADNEIQTPGTDIANAVHAPLPAAVHVPIIQADNYVFANFGVNPVTVTRARHNDVKMTEQPLVRPDMATIWMGGGIVDPLRPSELPATRFDHCAAGGTAAATESFGGPDAATHQARKSARQLRARAIVAESGARQHASPSVDTGPQSEAAAAATELAAPLGQSGGAIAAVDAAVAAVSADVGGDSVAVTQIQSSTTITTPRGSRTARELEQAHADAKAQAVPAWKEHASVESSSDSAEMASGDVVADSAGADDESWLSCGMADHHGSSRIAAGGGDVAMAASSPDRPDSCPKFEAAAAATQLAAPLAQQHPSAQPQQPPVARPSCVILPGEGMLTFSFLQQGSLGVQLQSVEGSSMVVVGAIAEGSQAAGMAGLVQGLVLASVQGDSVTGREMHEIYALVGAQTRPLRLTFRHQEEHRQQSSNHVEHTTIAVKDTSEADQLSAEGTQLRLSAATKVQARQRGRSTRTEHAAKKVATVRIQAVHRGRRVRRAYRRRQESAAVRVQSIQRGERVRQNVAESGARQHASPSVDTGPQSEAAAAATELAAPSLGQSGGAIAAVDAAVAAVSADVGGDSVAAASPVQPASSVDRQAESRTASLAELTDAVAANDIA
jgi:hypothetical protein